MLVVWVHHYSLKRYTKWHYPSKNICVGGIVILQENNLIPTKWPLARVIKVYAGKDDLVQVVAVKTSWGTYKRPIFKIALLLPSQDDWIWLFIVVWDHPVLAGGMLMFIIGCLSLSIIILKLFNFRIIGKDFWKKKGFLCWIKICILSNLGENSTILIKGGNTELDIHPQLP